MYPCVGIIHVFICVSFFGQWRICLLFLIMCIIICAFIFFLDFSIYVLRVLFTRGVEYMTFGILMMMMLIMLVMMYFFFEGYLPLHFWVLVYWFYINLYNLLLWYMMLWTYSYDIRSLVFWIDFINHFLHLFLGKLNYRFNTYILNFYSS